MGAPQVVAVALAALVLLVGCSQPEPVDMTGDSSQQIQPSMDSAMKNEATCMDTIAELHRLLGEPQPTDLVKPAVRDAAATVIGPPPEDPTGAQARRWRGIVLLGTIWMGAKPSGAQEFCSRMAHVHHLYPGELPENGRAA